MRISVSYIFEIFLSLPKTICFNLRCLPLGKAMKFPFYVHYRTRLHGISRKSVKISPTSSLRPFMIKLGNKGSVGIVENRYNSICLNKGTINFKGSAAIGIGFSIRADYGGVITVGKGFNSNRNLFLSSTKEVIIGDDVLFGWNVSVRDSDGHTLLYDGVKQPTLLPVHVGNHVWVCAESHILKGAIIGDNCVVGYASLLAKGSTESELLWVGHPAKPVKAGIRWERSAWDV